MKDFKEKLSTKNNSLLLNVLDQEKNKIKPVNYRTEVLRKPGENLRYSERKPKISLKGKKEDLTKSLKKIEENDNSILKIIEVESDVSSFVSDFQNSFRFGESQKNSIILEGNQRQNITCSLKLFESVETVETIENIKSSQQENFEEEDFIYVPKAILTSRIKKSRIKKQGSFSFAESSSKATVDSEDCSFNRLKKKIAKEPEVDQEPLACPKASMLWKYI